MTQGYFPPPPPPNYLPQSPKPKAPKGLAIASLITGILALLFSAVPIGSLLVGTVAVVMGVVALRQAQSKGMSITGIITGGLGILICVVATAVGGFTIDDDQPSSPKTEQTETSSSPSGTTPETSASSSSTPSPTPSDTEEPTPTAEPTPTQDTTPTEDEISQEPTSQAPEETASGSVSQQNALDQAESYLDVSAFSRTGLIEQLEFEGFSNADATNAADSVTVDWNEQAAKMADDYLDFTSFSRSELIEQLVFEGFSQAEAEYGVNQTGL